jgi:hypothetical protein
MDFVGAPSFKSLFFKYLERCIMRIVLMIHEVSVYDNRQLLLFRRVSLVTRSAASKVPRNILTGL